MIVSKWHFRCFLFSFENLSCHLTCLFAKCYIIKTFSFGISFTCSISLPNTGIFHAFALSRIVASELTTVLSVRLLMRLPCDRRSSVASAISDVFVIPFSTEVQIHSHRLFFVFSNLPRYAVCTHLLYRMQSSSHLEEVHGSFHCASIGSLSLVPVTSPTGFPLSSASSLCFSGL